MRHLLYTFFFTLSTIGFFTFDIQALLLSPEMGTIIVCYQTDLGGQRLDRIRFWLINDQHERTLYPKKEEFVSNSHTPNERTVVITHLPAGNYRIEFLIPNCDQIFEQVPARSLTLHPGAIIKIDQAIRLSSQTSLAPSLSKDITFAMILEKAVEDDKVMQDFDLESLTTGGDIRYDSLADGVRVSERLAVPSNYSDTFTGFRVAKSSP